MNPCINCSFDEKWNEMRKYKKGGCDKYIQNRCYEWGKWVKEIKELTKKEKK